MQLVLQEEARTTTARPSLRVWPSGFEAAVRVGRGGVGEGATGGGMERSEQGGAGGGGGGWVGWGARAEVGDWQVLRRS